MLRGPAVQRVLFALSGVLVVAGLAALGAGWYDRAHRNELLPGITVDGVAVGGQPAAAVLRILGDRLPPVGATTVQVQAGPEQVQLTLAELGLRSDAAEVVARAQADATSLGLGRRTWHRVLGRPLERAYEVRLTVDRAAVRRAVTRLAAKVDLAPADARVDTSTGMVSILPAVEGRAVDVPAATERLFETARRVANAGGRVTVALPVTALAPAVTGYADVLLVRTAENKLYHYDNGVLAKTYTVATGTARYPTPRGNFNVVLKRRNPTWVNPDPGGWGASLPARIGPGPRNPLGTRAMNLDAPGIRIHGTSNVASLGRNASHGCIRMAMSDVEELFELVEQGTPVAIIQGPPPAPVAPTAITPAPGAPPVPVPATSLGDPNAPVDLEAG